LQDYFHRSVSHAVDRHHVVAGDATVHYLASLLTHFARSENLFDRTEEGVRLRPLAHLYADAVYSDSEHERRLMLRRMGDVALFVSGMFSGFFKRRRALVGMDYYIAMGGQAYASLAGDPGTAGAAGDMQGEDVFARLSSGFGEFVMVLTEVGNEGAHRRSQEVAALIATWSQQDASHPGLPPGWAVVGTDRNGRH